MIIPPNAILKAPEAEIPVRGLSERELTNPEGVGFDLRLASVSRIHGAGALMAETRYTSQASEEPFEQGETWHLASGAWFLVQTIETVALPKTLAGLVFPRSTLFRSGVALHSSVVPPGYVGPLTFGLCVHSSDAFAIEKGARFCHLVLYEVADGATLYRGQWSGGRLVQPDEEAQI